MKYHKEHKERTAPNKAVALTYDPSASAAPIVVAKGKGETANRIIELAKENKIPVQEDPSLVSLLSKLEISEQIPAELYEVVAEIFAFIYRLDKESVE